MTDNSIKQYLMTQHSVLPHILTTFCFAVHFLTHICCSDGLICQLPPLYTDSIHVIPCFPVLPAHLIHPSHCVLQVHYALRWSDFWPYILCYVHLAIDHARHHSLMLRRCYSDSLRLLPNACRQAVRQRYIVSCSPLILSKVYVGVMLIWYLDWILQLENSGPS